MKPNKIYTTDPRRSDYDGLHDNSKTDKTSNSDFG